MSRDCQPPRAQLTAHSERHVYPVGAGPARPHRTTQSGMGVADGGRLGVMWSRLVSQALVAAQEPPQPPPWNNGFPIRQRVCDPGGTADRWVFIVQNCTVQRGGWLFYDHLRLPVQPMRSCLTIGAKPIAAGLKDLYDQWAESWLNGWPISVQIDLCNLFLNQCYSSTSAGGRGYLTQSFCTSLLLKGLSRFY